jgi:DnaK suppressor protein
MAAKKKTTKKKTASNSRKKVAKKKPVAKKKVSKKKVSRKKVAAKKKPSKKTAAKKKSTKKKVAKKKATKKKTAKKKAAKKTSVKKKVSKQKASKKKVAGKKASTKKASKKRISNKTVTTTTKKKPASKKINKKATQKAAPKVRSKHTGRLSEVNPLAVSDSDALIHGITPYRPRQGEEYMSDDQLEHFGNILNAWKQELMQEVDRTVHHMQDEASNFPDPNDRATQESEFGLELRTRDRERKLLKKIAQAMARVDDCSYGFCEETGEEIGLQRLEARPVATLCVEAQERRELAERQYSDREDKFR